MREKEREIREEKKELRENKNALLWLQFGTSAHAQSGFQTQTHKQKEPSPRTKSET